MAQQLVFVIHLAIVLALTLTRGQAGQGSEVNYERVVIHDAATMAMFEFLMDRIESQEEAIRQLQSTVAETSKKARTKTREIERLESIVCEVMEGLKEKNYQINRLENELQKINMDDSKPMVDRRQLLNKRDVTAVAFSAALQHNINIHEHEILAFGHVILDEGSGYNIGDGIYTVPQSGVYVFTWSITAGVHSGGHDVYTSLVINGSPVGSIDSDSDASNSGSSTGVVVIYVDQGDHVFIRTGSSGSIVSSGSAKSTFSGWLLF